MTHTWHLRVTDSSGADIAADVIIGAAAQAVARAEELRAEYADADAHTVRIQQKD